MNAILLSQRLLIAATIILLALDASAQDQNYFDKSYAVVIGIDGYRNPQKWPKLTYAVKDAKGFADFLQRQGFVVIELYDADATKDNIISALEDELVAKVTARDRVVVFFAGHGDTRALGEENRGYLVPVGGTEAYGTMIPVTLLHDISRAMSAAKHQLFILDSCFGGLAARRGVSIIDPRTPNYVDQISTRQARQLLTAGGANQRVRDGGPGGHSVFTGQLLKALSEGIGDSNGDGFVTFTELSSYIQTAASNEDQTPGYSVLDGHEQGDFWFVNPASVARSSDPEKRIDASSIPPPTVDVYEVLRSAKLSFNKKTATGYAESRPLFLQAAGLGNADAMAYLAKLLWEGWGGPMDKDRAIAWYKQAAERGHLSAMNSLAVIYEQRNQPQESQRWASAGRATEALGRDMEVIDPTGQATKRDPVLAPDASEVKRPAPPVGLRAE